MRVVATLVVATGVAGLLVASARPAVAPRIVFAADRNPARTGEIYSYNLATGRTRDISRSLATDSGPGVSPDGKWIAFWSMRSGRLGLYVARIDGSGLRLVQVFHRGLYGWEVH